MHRRKRSLIILTLFCLASLRDGALKAEELDEYFNTFYPPGYVFKDEEDEIGNDLLSPKENEAKELGLKEFMADTGIFYGSMWAVRLFYVRNKDERIFDTSFSKWIDNITQWPVVDDGDSIITNYIYHPIFGAVYYLFYRARGHTIWASAIGSALMSTLFEYTVEGLVETPSFPDLIATPGIGVPMGILAENISDWLVERDNIPAKVAGHIINPMRLFIRDRQIGILNPLTGTFAFHGPFNVTANKARALQFGYPFFIESPVPLGKADFNFEVLDLKGRVGGGQFIFYSIRLDFNSSNNRFDIYLEYPYSGVNNVTVNGQKISDGFEFSNLLFGSKFVLIDSQNFILSGGLEVIAPTAFKDNLDRLKTVTNYRRDFPLYLQGATTITPYLSAGMRKKRLSLISNLGIDLVLNADRLEGDDFEARIKYGTAVGATLPLLTHPSLFCEFTGYTFVTSSKVERTDIFVTPGLRLGKRFSPGFGVQIPLTGSTSDLANASFMVDLQLRF